MTAEGQSLVEIRLADVKPESVSWVWERRVARGKLNLIDGDPGTGKTTICLDLCARRSSGRAAPFETGAPRPPENVLFLTAEDGIGDTLRPRLEALGADLERVFSLQIREHESETDRGIIIPDDIPAIEQYVSGCEIALVVLDPLTAFLSGGVNSWRDHDVRRALSPLASMAERTSSACLGIRHLTKASQGSALYRGGGSIAFTGAARVVMLVGRAPQDESRCVLAVTKNNIAEKPASLLYSIEQAPNGSSRIIWEGETSLTADQIAPTAQNAGERTARDEACDFLRDYLGECPRTAKEVFVAARQAGHSETTIQRAKMVLGVKPARKGGRDGHWTWELPSTESPVTTFNSESDISSSKNKELQRWSGKDGQSKDGQDGQGGHYEEDERLGIVAGSGAAA